MNKPTDLLWCIECTDLDSNTIGDFVYHKQAPFRAISPVYTNLAELFVWMKRQGYATGTIADQTVYERDDHAGNL